MELSRRACLAATTTCAVALAIPLKGRADGSLIDVSTFGAVGDGVADDTAAISDALYAAEDGDEVYFPTGIYRITSSLALPEHLITLMFSGAGRNLAVLDAGEEPCGIEISAGQSVEVMDMSFAGPAPDESVAGERALTIQVGADVTIRDCSFLSPTLDECVRVDGRVSIAG